MKLMNAVLASLSSFVYFGQGWAAGKRNQQPDLEYDLDLQIQGASNLASLD